jgi:hypothetical protein
MCFVTWSLLQQWEVGDVSKAATLALAYLAVQFLLKAVAIINSSSAAFNIALTQNAGDSRWTR